MKTRFLLLTFLLFSITLFFQNCATEANTSNDSISKNETISETSPPTLSKQEIAPPSKELDVPFKSFEIKTTETQTLNLENGTSIDIPANAFVDANGQAITTPVQIQYREFHTAADLVASGIPMKASHNGQTGIMQTAGMFEINATADDVPVFVDNQKNITVNMASNIGEEGYDFWAFDKKQGSWINKGTSTPQPNTQKQAAKKELASLEKIKTPTPPAQFDKKKAVLNFDLNIESFPELKKMKNIFWQYTGIGKNPKEAKWIFQEKWQTAKLKKSKRPNQYTLILKNENRSFSTSVCPSQKGEELDNAMANYNQEMKTYQSSRLTKNERKNFMKRQADFVRSFKINDMGIYNYDILRKNPDNLLFAANFDFGAEVPKAHHKVNIYLITNEGRSVVAFPYRDRKKFGINPDMDNLLVAILPNHKIATFSQQDFDENLNNMRSAVGDTYTFKMNVSNTHIENIADFSKAIAAL